MQKENKTLIVLHQQGIKSHYTGAVAAAKYLGYNEIHFYEFSFIKKFFKSILNANFSLLKKQILNCKFILSAISNPKKLDGCTIIIGMAPFDPFCVLYKIISSHCRTIYHTSWHDWEEDNVPRKNFFLKRTYVKLWKEMLLDENTTVAAVTEQSKHSINQNIGTELCRIYVVGHAFDNNHQKPQQLQKEISIVFCGRLVKEKGVDKIISVAKKLPNVKFNIIGDGPEIKQLSKESCKNIIFFGEIKDKCKIYEVYSRCHYIMQPSIKNNKWEELFGMSIIEAMSVGVVPITTNHIGPKEIFGHSALGVNIFSEADFEEKSIAKLISHTPSTWEIESKQAVKIANNFNISSATKKWIEILK